MHTLARGAALTFCLLGVASAGSAQIPVPPDAASILSAEYPGTSYSPYAGRDFPSTPFWGDSHLHSSFSFDAGAFGNRLGPVQAYRFAAGAELVSSSGIKVKLSRPLDWLALTDHSDNMGFFPDLLAGKPHIVAEPQGKDWLARIQAGKGVEVALEIIRLFSQGRFPKSLSYLPDSAAYKSAWQATVEAAEATNAPGRFTALIGYEWTSLVKGNNMHRVVIYRDDGDKALQMLPYTTYPPAGSPDPRDLWKWLERYEKQTGGDILAIPHNGNLSNGIMFPLDAQWNGTLLDDAYVKARDRWEPLYEVTQIKGDGEAHPYLSPEDEFANYETWDVANLDASAKKTDDMLAGEYSREALKRGLVIGKRLGTNPYAFGQIGATDSHTSLATAQEDNFFGKHTGSEPSPDRAHHPFYESENGRIEGWQQVSSGLAAVWAPENTRQALFDAMERKEVYGTTGSRPLVRFFGGWDYTEKDLQSRNPAFSGYDKGVPMGSHLKERTGKGGPRFMVFALRDPIGANLDRIQIVKGWVDTRGATQEKVYDVAWSDGRTPGRDGRLPPVGDTVDAATASYTNTIGASELGTVWQDPDFDAALPAFYYARILEIPTPRWTTFDAFRFDTAIPEGAPVSTQERAYTSPIWYGP